MTTIIQPDLVNRAVCGEAGALNLLFDRCRPQLYAIALRLCGNTPAAEDAVQEALLLAYTRLHQLKDPAAFVPWMSRIITNCCYQLLRNNGHYSFGLGSDALIEDSIHRRFEDMGTRNTLYAALSSLPEHLRITMMLRFLSDFSSYAQIAEILGVPIGTVRSRLSEGKKQLTRHWQQLQHAGAEEYGRVHYWNKLYAELFTGMYDDVVLIQPLMQRLSESLKLVFTSGKTVWGREIFEESIYDDMEHGSRLSEVRSCITSGNLTVMNVSFANSDINPDHCPPGSFLILERGKELVTSMRLYHAARNTQVVESRFA